MKKVKQILSLIATAIIAFTLSVSCEDGNSNITVSKLEKCLGDVKTNSDFKNLSYEHTIEIAKCMLVHMNDYSEEYSSKSSTDKAKMQKEFRAAMFKSEYKDVLLALDYLVIENLANLEESNRKSFSLEEADDDFDEDEPVTKKSSGNNWDKVLEDYDAFADKLIQMVKSAKAGNKDYKAEWEAYRMENEQSLRESFLDVPDEMTPAQLQKYMDIRQKLLDAYMDL